MVPKNAIRMRSLWGEAFVVIMGICLTGFVNCEDPGKIHGCGGYVRSSFKLEFHQIEIKLYTKQGSLTMKTDCAPTTGYYFIPLERRGDYVLRISPPEGWTFDPPEYEIKFDGETDLCSREIDLNFDFKGFSVYGQVVSSGDSEGPSGVKMTLSGPHDLKLETVTKAKGAFSFDKIPPGKYSLKASQPDLLFENDNFSFETINKNIDVGDKIRVSGYVVTGSVFSDSKPVDGVSVILYGKPGSKPLKNCPTAGEKLSIHKDSDETFLCVTTTDASGKFRFVGVVPALYSVVPVYRGNNIVYDLSPEKQTFHVKHGSVTLPTDFQVEGFTVQGKVKDLSGASILVNGKAQAVTGADGSFSIARMKPGNYEFQVVSDKYQFDPVKLEVSASRPELPVFTPSRFLVCGEIQGKDLNQQQLTLQIKPKNPQKSAAKIISERVEDASKVCIFLPTGSYDVTVTSSPERFFIPANALVQVPSTKTKAFEFRQFQGKISGAVDCNLGCPSGVVLNVDSNGVRVKQLNLKGPNKQIVFSVDNLESGNYRISVDQDDSKFCWENDGIREVSLKDANIENLSLKQVGFKLQLSASHDTGVKIMRNQVLDRELQLKGGDLKDLCLRNPEVHKIIPTSCHVFDSIEYMVTPGSVSEVQLHAVKHTITGSVVSREKIDDLRIKVNDELLNEGKVVEGKKTADGQWKHEVVFSEAPGAAAVITFQSVGFSFEPTETTVIATNDCQLNVFSARALKAYIIKGKLTPALEGAQVQIELIGDAGEPVIVQSDSTGEYIAGPFIHSSGFKVTPTKPGYVFSALPNDPYSFTVYQLAKIQVQVLGESPNEVLTNALLSLSGPNAYRQNRYTDANGEMTFTDLQPGQYYLKALLKEYRFEPSAVNIQLSEQETKSVTVKAKKESFSLYGQLFCLNGELVPNLLVSAKGTGACAEYGEEGLSDENGNFRIWALKSACTYSITVSTGGEGTSKVERTIPSSLEVTIGQEDLKNVSFLVMTPVTRMDVSVRVRTNKDKYLDSLNVFIYSSRSPDIPMHRVSFSGYPFLILPQVPKDDSEYTITFEAKLGDQFKYKLPTPITFIANESFSHHTVDFFVEPAPMEQDIGKSSYIAMTIVVIAIVASMYFDKIAKVVKLYMENHASASSLSSSKKTKVKSK